MNALLITDLVGSVIVIVGFAFGALRWGRRSVRAIEGWVKRVGDNTTATQQLTGVVSGVRDDIREVVATLRQHGEQLADHSEQLADHRERIGLLEKGGPDGAP